MRTFSVFIKSSVVLLSLIMKITILAVGGRGDVEPLLILGKRLSEEGFDLIVVTHHDFEGLVDSYGLKSSYIRAGIRELFQGEYGAGTYSTESNYFRSWFNFYRMFGAVLYSSAEDCWEACRSGTDLIIYSPPCLYFAPQIAEKLKITSIPVFFQPFHPTGEFPHYISPIQRNISRTFNLMTHKIADHVMWIPYLPTINRFRKNVLGLKPISVFSGYVGEWRQSCETFIYAFSRFVMPKPADWGSNTRITGYFFPEKEPDTPDRSLIEFIESGDKPVFIGFSSTVLHEPGKISAILTDVFERLKKRVVLATGWSGMHDIDFPENFYKVPSVPHNSIFPKMSLIIHHGGAGSTGAAFRAGVPAIVIPFAADQYFWGLQVEKTGCGPSPLPARNLNSENLYNTLKHVLENSDYYLRSRELGCKINNEKGVENVVKLIKDC